jgi:hypothetical protein
MNTFNIKICFGRIDILHARGWSSIFGHLTTVYEPRHIWLKHLRIKSGKPTLAWLAGRPVFLASLLDTQF